MIHGHIIQLFMKNSLFIYFTWDYRTSTISRNSTLLSLHYLLQFFNLFNWGSAVLFYLHHLEKKSYGNESSRYLWPIQSKDWQAILAADGLHNLWANQLHLRRLIIFAIFLILDSICPTNCNYASCLLLHGDTICLLFVCHHHTLL